MKTRHHDHRPTVEERTVIFDGEPLVLKPFYSWRYWRPIVQILGEEKVLQLKRQSDRKCQDLSDAIWLREAGTIPGAPARTPSRKAIALSKVKV
jgi:hypothetical protein